MFKEMRRMKQEMSKEDTQRVLERCSAGVLAVSDENGYPYALPMSYVYFEGKIYFHGAKQGHKIDAIMKNDKVSFCVIDKDQVVPEKFTTIYRSVIAFGRARILENDAERRSALEKITEKYSPKEPNHGQEIEKQFSRVCVIEMEIEHLTGKESMELRKLSV
ncbi:MAG: pyridoxamine 5'-phosphate oxidase family protein [Oscillospiraceae bacterium]